MGLHNMMGFTPLEKAGIALIKQCEIGLAEIFEQIVDGKEIIVLVQFAIAEDKLPLFGMAPPPRLPLANIMGQENQEELYDRSYPVSLAISLPEDVLTALLLRYTHDLSVRKNQILKSENQEVSIIPESIKSRGKKYAKTMANLNKRRSKD